MRSTADSLLKNLGAKGAKSWVPKRMDINDRPIAAMMKYCVLMASEVLIKVSVVTANNMIEPVILMFVMFVEKLFVLIVPFVAMGVGYFSVKNTPEK